MAAKTTGRGPRRGRPGIRRSEPVRDDFRVSEDAELVIAMAKDGRLTDIATTAPPPRRRRGPDKGKRKPRNGGAPADLTETRVNAGIWATVQLLPGGTDPKCRTIESATKVIVYSRPVIGPGNFRGARQVSA